MAIFSESNLKFSFFTVKKSATPAWYNLNSKLLDSRAPVSSLVVTRYCDFSIAYKVELSFSSGSTFS